MKKFLLIFWLLTIANIAAFSQEVDRKFTIQTSPYLYILDIISLGTGDSTASRFIMDLEGQYKINETINISLTLSFLVDNGIIVYDHSNYGSSSYEANVFQMCFKPMFIYRPFKTGLAGFFIGAYPTIGWQTLKSESEDYVWANIGIGINTGYKWIFSKGFTLQLGGGIGKTWSIPEKPEKFVNSIMPINSDGRITLKNFDIQLDFKLGYSF